MLALKKRSLSIVDEIACCGVTNRSKKNLTKFKIEIEICFFQRVREWMVRAKIQPFIYSEDEETISDSGTLSKVGVGAKRMKIGDHGQGQQSCKLSLMKPMQ